MIALVAGATGLVGRELVRQLSADGAWSRVTALVRRTLPPELAGPGVVPVEVDYTQLNPSPDWARVDQVFCALGTTMRQAGSRAAFRRVDFEYPVGLAQATLALGAKHFLLVSSIGADAQSRMFYSRTKGEVEAAITALGFRSVTIVRPSLLLGERPEPRMVERVGKLIGLLSPPRWRPVPATLVAQALVTAAKRDLPGVRIIENQELRTPA
jgi:uncharacterized protein YbjT (DUF2867 family)